MTTCGALAVYANTDTFNRNQGQLNAEGQINGANNTAASQSRAEQAGNLGTAWNMGNQTVGNAISGAGVYTGGLNSTTGTVTGAMQNQNANNALENLIKQANSQPPINAGAPNGFFNLGI